MVLIPLGGGKGVRGAWEGAERAQGQQLFQFTLGPRVFFSLSLQPLSGTCSFLVHGAGLAPGWTK